MKIKKRKYEDISPINSIRLRDSLGIKKYRKSVKRDDEERKILLTLALKKIEEREKDDFILLGFRRRKVRI